MSQSEDSPRPAEYYVMTPKRIGCLDRLRGWMTNRLERRHYAGQREHGGDLERKACYPMLGSELIDSLTYYHTHLNRLHIWRTILIQGLDGNISLHAAATDILNQLNLEIGPEDSAEVFDEIPNR